MERSRSSSSALLLLLLLFLVAPRAGRAGDEFGAHYRRADALYEQGRYEASLKELQEAYAIKQLPRLLLNIGQLHLKLGRPQEALRFYQSYLDADPHPDPEVRHLIDQGTDQAHAMIAADQHIREPAITGAPPAPPAVSPPARSLNLALNVAPSVARNAGPAGWRPVYRRWWFWTAIGAAVALGATATALLVTQPWTPADPGVIRNLEGKF